MSGEEAAELERASTRMRKTCAAIKALFYAGFALVAAFSAVFFVVAVPRAGTGDAPVLLNALLVAVCCGTVAWSLARFFSDVAAGSEPFSRKQARRLRAVAACFLVLFVCDFAFPDASLSFVTEGGLNVGFSSATDTTTPNINVVMLMMSALAYFLSVAFEYASLLQRNVDETL